MRTTAPHQKDTDLREKWNRDSTRLSASSSNAASLGTIGFTLSIPQRFSQALSNVRTDIIGPDGYRSNCLVNMIGRVRMPHIDSAASLTFSLGSITAEKLVSSSRMAKSPCRSLAPTSATLGSRPSLSHMAAMKGRNSLMLRQRGSLSFERTGLSGFWRLRQLRASETRKVANSMLIVVERPRPEPRSVGREERSKEFLESSIRALRIVAYEATLSFLFGSIGDII